MAGNIDPETIAAIQLNLTQGLGPRLQSLLLARFGSAEAVFQANGSELLAVQGIGPKVSAMITSGRSFEAAHVEYQKAVSHEISIVPISSIDYPRSLKEICDPPPVLYVNQELKSTDPLAVGIVGSRHCTHYGRTQAAKLAGALCRAGIVVVSGLARGIDGAAHRGAIDAGGRTIAVCAPGLLKMYPPEHKDLAREVVAQGAMISESPLDRAPQKGLFPQRNRIIAGLSLGVIIIEAGRKSGALHTARHAMEQGREVFVVPGRIDSSASDGCHDLIRDGATLIRDVNDVLESLGPLVEPVQTEEKKTVRVPRELNLNEQEQTVLNLIDTSSTSIEHVLAKAEMASSRVLSTLTVLEMKRLVRRLPGGSVERITG
ncbi:DNA-processing protein DprA [Planctomicrobium sp.]|jgi:DNA processing protein|nr:DNA-processing protein DprA [Planctomicrobium sp.]MBT5017475.1 DNA-protecting protein DprA [Planctomicrobium sp.]MDB4733486.1 DNA-processing protein DprA [Planctomicrobium sp.]